MFQIMEFNLNSCTVPLISLLALKQKPANSIAMKLNARQYPKSNQSELNRNQAGARGIQNILIQLVNFTSIHKTFSLWTSWSLYEGRCLYSSETILRRKKAVTESKSNNIKGTYIKFTVKQNYSDKIFKNITI